MKKLFKKISIWYLTKYYPIVHELISISHNEIKYNVKGYVKDDNIWHNYAFCLEYWLKLDKGISRLNDATIFVDGKLKDEK